MYLARSNPHDNKYRNNLIPCFYLSQKTRYFKQDYQIFKYLNMQMREEIWKWDVLDSSKDYHLLNNEDLISNSPAICQKLSNIENIINLVINYANEWRNLKTECRLHNYSLCSIYGSVKKSSESNQLFRRSCVEMKFVTDFTLKQYRPFICKREWWYENEMS
jgi:hypothetical protein